MERIVKFLLWQKGGNIILVAGDRLLRDFASLLRETMPPTAKLYRYGGDEFIAALHLSLIHI